MFAAIVGWNSTGLPDVNVNDGKWGRDWPGVNQLTVAANAGVGKDAVRARFQPGFYVRAELVPVESESDAVERFVGH